jgi:molybdopterin-guanine dinucleotide biosynthesis protein A
MNCYVLAGGRSQRMGVSKIDLPFAGTTFLGRISETARQLFERVIAVQRTAGEPLRGVETIFEAPHELEAPLFGVQRALQHAGERCFVVAVDYPLITADFLRHLRARFEETAAPALIPVWNGRQQVLCAGYAAELLPAIERQIAAKRLDLRGILADAEVIPEETLRARFAGEPLMNVNTPEELEEAKRLYDQQGLLASR